MKTKLFMLFVLLVAALIVGALLVKSVNASSRCVDSFTVTNLPVQPGRENAVDIPLEENQVVCTAFINDIHFGFEEYTQCKEGICIDGMEYGKYFNNGNFSIWYDGSNQPTEAVVYYRYYWEFETPYPYTPTPKVTLTPLPTPDVTMIPADPRSTPKVSELEDDPPVWLPLVTK